MKEQKHKNLIKRITLDVDMLSHAHIKLEAARRGMTIREFVLGAIRDAMLAEKERNTKSMVK